MRIISVFTVLLCLTALCGCGAMGGAKKAKKQNPIGGRLSLHVYHPQSTSEEGVATVYHVSGKPVNVTAKPLLSSEDVLAIKTLPVDGGVGLELYLTAHGRNVWAQASSQHADRSLVLLVDGEFRTLVRVPKSSDSGAFLLRGPFYPDEAQRIADFVNKREK